jgi:2-polyprenyl-3-methyl-5-hydroxy-6-metoxy-1,4-benzoquinol methylase
MRGIRKSHILRLYGYLPKWSRNAIHHIFAKQDFSPRNLDTQYREYWAKKTGGNLSVIPPPQAYKASYVLEHLAPRDTVIDIGCGNGAVIREIRRRMGSAKLIGADISPDCLDYLEREGFEVIRHDVTAGASQPALPETDWALLFEVLEHMPNPEQYLLDLWPRVKKGVFFSIPNTGYFPYRLRLLSGSFPIQWHVHPGEHVRFWTYSDLKRWLNNLGFEGTYQISVHSGVPVLQRIWGSLFGMGLIVKLLKAPAQTSAEGPGNDNVKDPAPNPGEGVSVRGETA